MTPTTRTGDSLHDAHAILADAEVPPEPSEEAAACRTVAAHATDAADLALLLDALGLLPETPEPEPEVEPGLPPIPHGTNRGYQQHYDRGDMPACRPCMEARSADARRRYHAARARKSGGAA